MKTQRLFLGAASFCAVLIIFTLLRGDHAGEGILFAATSKTGSEPNPSLGISREEMREVMLDGELASYWRVVDQKAPQDLTDVINRFYADEAIFHTQQDVRDRLDEELLSYRLNLAKYAPLLTDTQRIKFLNARIALLQAFDDPIACGVLARHGGKHLSYDQLREVSKEFDESAALSVAQLLDARLSGKEVRESTPAVTQAEVKLLVREMRESGSTERQMQILFDDSWKDPEYCSAMITYYESMVQLPGTAGVAIRVESVENLLNSK